MRNGRFWAASLFMICLIGGLMWIWEKRQGSDPARTVLEEVVFTELEPHLFRENRFFFKAKIDPREENSPYIFNLESGQLKKKDWTRHYGDSVDTYHLGSYGKLTVNRNRGKTALVLDRGGKSSVIPGLPDVKQPISLSPRGNAFIYAEKGSKGYDLMLFHVMSRKKHLLKENLTLGKIEGKDFVQWSAEGKYLLLDGRVVMEADKGEKVLEISGRRGVWSPKGTTLAFLSEGSGRKSEQGKQVGLLDVVTGEKRMVFQAERDEWVTQPVTWDPEGRYFVFPTGVKDNEEMYIRHVHVMDGKMFHYVESEQNVKPTRLTHVQLSPGGEYLSYAINGILKLVNLRTQESRVYDVYTQVERDQTAYVRYDPKGVWLAQSHRILYVKDNMEEKEVYRTPNQLTGFFLSTRRDKLLVMEEVPEGCKLRLVHFPSDQRSSANHSQEGNREEAEP